MTFKVGDRVRVRSLDDPRTPASLAGSGSDIGNAFQRTCAGAYATITCVHYAPFVSVSVDSLGDYAWINCARVEPAVMAKPQRDSESLSEGDRDNPPTDAPEAGSSEPRKPEGGSDFKGFTEYAAIHAETHDFAKARDRFREMFNRGALRVADMGARRTAVIGFDPAQQEEPAGSRGDELVNGERMDEYGPPSESFARVAAFWTTYLTGVAADPLTVPALTGEDVGKMMILLKVSRSITDGKADTLDDIEGYVSCIRMIRDA